MAVLRRARRRHRHRGRDGARGAPAPRVHEYGGGAWWVRDGVLWFADWATQRLHRVAPGERPGGRSRPEPDVPAGPALRRRRRQPGRHHAPVRPGGAPRRRARGHQHDRAPRRPRRRRRPRWSSSGPDFVADPRWRADGGRLLLARVGPPRHAVGRHPPRRRRGRRPHRGGRAATSGSRSASPRGRPTGRSGSAATAPGSGASTAGRPRGGVEPMVDLGKDIGFPQWVFGQRASPSSPTAGVAFATRRRRRAAGRAGSRDVGRVTDARRCPTR